MMLSQTAEHALRAVLFLARQPDGARVPAETIAEALDAPRNYLAKTLGALAKAGVIDGMRGPTGGFALRVPPGQLTLARVVGAFDEPPSSRMCLVGGRRCDGRDPCVAHGRWNSVRTAARAPMERTTIADLLDPSASAGGPEPGPGAPGCTTEEERQWVGRRSW